MRIKTWLCGFLMLPFFSLTSCDTTSQSTSQTPTETVDILEDTRPETVEMTTITTLNGDEVTYNKNNRRIITLSGTGDVLALGIRPYACDGNVITTGYEDFFTDEVSILNYTQPFNSEELMMYHPDVILVYDTMDISDINKLEEVASQAVIPIYYEEYDYAKRLTYLGELFGLEDNTKKVIEQTGEMIASYVDELEKLNLKGKTLTVFSYYSNGICIPPTYRDGWTFNKILYQDLGMTTIETVTSASALPLAITMKEKFGIDYLYFTDLFDKKIHIDKRVIAYGDVDLLNYLKAVLDCKELTLICSHKNKCGYHYSTIDSFIDEYKDNDDVKMTYCECKKFLRNVLAATSLGQDYDSEVRDIYDSEEFITDLLMA